MTTTKTLTQLDTDSAVIAELAQQAAARQLVTVNDDLAILVRSDDQYVEQFDLEQYRDHPSRKKGKVTLTDADSFVTYVDRYSLTKATTQWADINQARIIAVLDDHAAHADADTEGDANWGQHRATLQLVHTKDWLHWLKLDGKYVTQKDFAEHLEDGIDAIHEPAAADMLEVAQTFHAKSGANFLSHQQLSGEVEFRFEETVKAKAGQTGTIDVPQIFTLGLVPFEGGTVAEEVKARFRFRLVEGNLALGYRLIRPDKALKTAFTDVVNKVASASGLPVMQGTPRSS